MGAYIYRVLLFMGCLQTYGNYARERFAILTVEELRMLLCIDS